MNDDDFSEELDNLSLKAFGHTNWEYHADTDLKKFVIIRVGQNLEELVEPLLNQYDQFFYYFEDLYN